MAVAAGEPAMTNLAGARVLVTGGRGFIGQAVTERFAVAGATVVGTTLAEPPDESPIEWVRLDVRSLDEVRKAVLATRPDVLVHLAAKVAGDRRIEQLIPMLEADLLGAVHVLLAATEAGVGRVIYAGSLLQEPTRDLAEPIPPSPYGAAKWAAAGYARMFHAIYGTPVVTVRPSLVYGPRQVDLTKMVPYVTTTLLRGETAELTSGAWEVDWLFVDDLADAIVAAAFASDVEGLTVDLGSGQVASVREIALMITELVGGSGQLALGAIPDRALDPVKIVDTGLATRALGWSAQVGLDAGLRATVDWYRSWVAGGGTDTR